MFKPTIKEYAVFFIIQLALILGSYSYLKHTNISFTHAGSTWLAKPSEHRTDVPKIPLFNKQEKWIKPDSAKRTIPLPPVFHKIFISQNKIFNKNYIYKGDWYIRSSFNPISQKPDKRRGDTYSTFSYDLFPNSIRFLVNFRENEYTDGKHVVVPFELLDSEFNPENSTMTFNFFSSGYLRVESISHLAFRESNYSEIYSAKLSFVDISTGLPFDLNATAVDVPVGESLENNELVDESSSKLDLTKLKIVLELVSEDLNFSLYSEMKYYEDSGISLTQPVVYMFLIVFSLLLIIEGSNKLEEFEDYYFMSNISYLSLFFLTIIHFQYIGAFVLFMVVIDTSFVLFFIFASIITTFSTIFVYKTCFIAFLYRYIDHPLINSLTYRSPRVLFTGFSLVSLIFSYTLSILLVGFHSYAYYLTFLHIYPAIHVYNSTVRGTRLTFSKYIQLYIWWPSALFAIMLRGYDGNMLNLEPSYLMLVSISFLLISCTLVSYFQMIKGPYFFLPKILIPGYNRMMIPISKVEDDTLLENCPICYYILLIDPMKESEVELHEQGKQNSLKEDLVKKNRYIMKTPCNHYFHELCLVNWIEKKQCCPLCKAPIKYF